LKSRLAGGRAPKKSVLFETKKGFVLLQIKNNNFFIFKQALPCFQE